LVSRRSMGPLCSLRLGKNAFPTLNNKNYLEFLWVTDGCVDVVRCPTFGFPFTPYVFVILIIVVRNLSKLRCGTTIRVDLIVETGEGRALH